VAHEQSVTLKRGKKYVNVTGPGVVHTPGAEKPGTVLRPLFKGEKRVYASQKEAVAAARMRSEKFGRAVDTSMARHRRTMSHDPHDDIEFP